jgi:hypothetical protein
MIIMNVMMGREVEGESAGNTDGKCARRSRFYWQREISSSLEIVVIFWCKPHGKTLLVKLREVYPDTYVRCKGVGLLSLC